jgi:hypothetical protein
MSQPVSRITHPFDIVYHPTLEPEVKRAILASWASDAAAVPDQPALRRPEDIKKPVLVDDVLAALRALDGDALQATRHDYADVTPTAAISRSIDRLMRGPSQRWRERRGRTRPSTHP